MNKRFLCLTSIDGYRVRMRADTVVEYGDLYAEDSAVDYSNKVVVNEKRVIGSYINVLNQDGGSTMVRETADQIDGMFSNLGFEFSEDEDSDPVPSPASIEREELAEASAEGITQHLNKYDSLFDRVWERYKKTQPSDPSKWARVDADCCGCDKAEECGRATPDNPDEVKHE